MIKLKRNEDGIGYDIEHSSMYIKQETKCLTNIYYNDLMELLKQLEELRMKNNPIVAFLTRNGKNKVQ